MDNTEHLQSETFFLHFLAYGTNEAQKRAVLNTANTQQVRLLREMALNVLEGTIPVSPTDPLREDGQFLEQLVHGRFIRNQLKNKVQALVRLAQLTLVWLQLYQWSCE